ncbi:hypothetical protein F4804DRAFT_64577 [Jackrogersella minutella]|nr:hypothetical protein F4804DRAFT_64577 [Jackrogersella minutella]
MHHDPRIILVCYICIAGGTLSGQQIWECHRIHTRKLLFFISDATNSVVVAALFSLIRYVYLRPLSIPIVLITPTTLTIPISRNMGEFKILR